MHRSQTLALVALAAMLIFLASCGGKARVSDVEAPLGPGPRVAVPPNDPGGSDTLGTP